MNQSRAPLSSPSATAPELVSQALNGETIGLEQLDDTLWNILYYDTLLGRYDQHKRRITGVPALRGKC